MHLEVYPGQLAQPNHHLSTRSLTQTLLRLCQTFLDLARVLLVAINFYTTFEPSLSLIIQFREKALRSPHVSIVSIRSQQGPYSVHVPAFPCVPSRSRGSHMPSGADWSYLSPQRYHRFIRRTCQLTRELNRVSSTPYYLR